MSAVDVHLTEAQLGDLADGTLVGAEREGAERHVAACAACRQEMAEARAMLAMARRARDGVTAPPELWPLVAASTVHAARLRRRTLRSMRGVLVLAAAALVLGTAVVTAAVTAWLRATPAEQATPAKPVTQAEQAVREAEQNAQRAAERARRDLDRGDPSRHQAGPPPSAPPAPRPPRPQEP